jgi:hypothetical protein
VSLKADAGCWQPSISSYYYTPARGVLVGSLFAVALALIVYFARGFWEDFFLNLAGMFLPIVAVAPTMDTGSCFVTPAALPRNPDQTVAQWVIDAINNNILSLLVTAAILIVVTFVVLIKMFGFMKVVSPPRDDRLLQRIVGLLVAAAFMVVITAILKLVWDDFYTRAHGFSALAFFASLFLAILCVALRDWKERDRTGRRKVVWRYVLVVGAMALVAIGIVGLEIADVSVLIGAYSILILEVIEVGLFATYWGMQTYQKWKHPESDVIMTGEEAAMQ